ncbi:MAG: septum formation initiator family protein [Firmicutes bacterium]|nr:septum formation initiator family protein [Bacillota bacterium]
MVLAGDQVLRPLPQERQPAGKTRRKVVPARRLKISSLVLLGFALGVIVILCQARITYVGYRLQELKREMAQVQEENEAIDGALQRLAAPDKIEAIAMRRLGMISPRPGEEIKLSVPALRKPETKTASEAGKNGGARCGEKSWFGVLLEILSFERSGSASKSYG